MGEAFLMGVLIGFSLGWVTLQILVMRKINQLQQSAKDKGYVNKPDDKDVSK